MASLAFTADVHVGNPSAFGGSVVAGVNERGRQVLQSLDRAVKETQDRGMDALVICGDLFDTANPSPQLISEVQCILSDAPKVICLMGNHDMVSDTPGDNALGPLIPLPNVMTVETPEIVTIGDVSLLCVPFQVGDCREWFPKVVESLATLPMPEGTRKVMAFHLGVIDKSTPAFLAKAHDAIELEVVQGLMGAHGIEYAFCGNWHAPQKWGRLVQCGALCPTGWDNEGSNYGKMALLDTDTKFLASAYISGPRFLVADSAKKADALLDSARMAGDKVYLSLKGAAAEDTELIARLREAGVPTRVVLGSDGAKEATRAAARSVRGAATLEDALARYIAAMPVPDSVDREQVLALSRKYLGG